MPQGQVRVILFDFGGVLLRLRDPVRTFGIGQDRDSFNKAWLMSQAVRALECGQIGIDEFASRAVQEFDLPYSEREFLERFASWPHSLFSGVPELLASLRPHFKLALLSNTNPVHWNHAGVANRLEPLFDRLFLSWQTGLLKPDIAAYTQVTENFGTKPQEIFFLDDNQMNLDGARAAGMQVRLTRGAAELATALQAAGLLCDLPETRES